MERLTISTENLAIGLYVADLDRPWLETPFLFQGFLVADDEDIAELRKHCKKVVIDIVQSNLPPADIQKLASINKPREKMPPSAPAYIAKTKVSDIPEPDFSKTGKYYLNTEELGNELVRAQEIEQEASKAINSVFAKVHEGGSLDVPQLEQVVDPLVDSVLRNSDAMAWLMRIREKDEYIYQHSIGSSVWAVVFGRHLGFNKETLNAVGLGGMLLDIGKTRMSVELLRKPGKLDKEETQMMRKHVDYGLEILREAGTNDARIEIMLATHHERFDGTGYPNGLKDTQIPVLGRVAGIVDCYDAMVSKRSYAETLSTFDAMRQLQTMAKSKFQKEMVDQFVQAVGMFPTGSLVELNTGQVAVVTAQNNYQRLKPEVMVILDHDKQLCEDFRTLDLRMNMKDEFGKETVWIDRGLEPGSFGIDPAEYFL